MVVFCCCMGLCFVCLMISQDNVDCLLRIVSFVVLETVMGPRLGGSLWSPGKLMYEGYAMSRFLFD